MSYLQKCIIRGRTTFETSLPNVAFLYKRPDPFYWRIKIAILPVEGNETRQFCEPLYFKEIDRLLCWWAV